MLAKTFYGQLVLQKLFDYVVIRHLDPQKVRTINSIGHEGAR